MARRPSNHFDNPLETEVSEEMEEAVETDEPNVVDIDMDGNILRTYTPEEMRLRDKIFTLFCKFDSSGNGVISLAETDRVLVNLGLKPADIALLITPMSEAETEHISMYAGGADRLSTHNRRSDKNMIDIGVLTERVARLVEGAPVLINDDTSDALNDDLGVEPPKRRKSVENIIDKYAVLSGESFKSVGLVRSILDARLHNITSGWRRRYCDNVPRRIWDCFQLVIMCIFFVAIATFNAAEHHPEPLGWWITFVVFHFFWILDMILCSVTACRNEDTGKLTLVIKDIIYYRRHSLIIDLIGLLPVDMVLWWFADPHDHTLFYTFLAFRALKCVKLLKIGFLFEIVNNDIITASDVTFFYQAVPIIRRTGISINLVHVLVLVVDHSHETYRTYLEALMYTLSMVFGAGPSVMWDTEMDFVVMMVLIVISVFVRGIIIGQIHVLLFEGDVGSQNLAVMQGTVALLKHYDCSDDLQQEILSFQRHLVSDDISHHLSVLEMLPEQMQNEVQTCMKTAALNSVPFLSSVASDVRIELAGQMQRKQAVPGEILIELHKPQDRAFVIAHGSVDILGPTNALVRTVDAPGFFGETGLLGIRHALARFSARAVTYTDLWVLSRESFEHLMFLHGELIVSIEEYFGPGHPFMANLEHVFEDYVKTTEQLALEVKDAEEIKLARSTSQMSNRSAGAKPTTPPSAPTPPEQRPATLGLPARHTSDVGRKSDGLLYVESESSRQGSTASAMLGTAYSSTHSLNAGAAAAATTTKRASVAQKVLSAISNFRQNSISKNNAAAAAATPAAAAAPAASTTPQPVSPNQLGSGADVTAATPKSPPMGSKSPNQQPISTSGGEGRSSSLKPSSRWHAVLRNVTAARHVLQNSSPQDDQDNDARPPQLSSDNDFTPLPSAGPTPKNAVAASNTRTLSSYPSSHQMVETEFGGVALSRHNSAMSDRRQLSSITRPSTVFDEDTGSTASSGVPGANRQQREWMMTFENRVDTAANEVKDLVNTIRHLQATLRDLMTVAKQRSSVRDVSPGKSGRPGGLDAGSVGPDQWYNDEDPSQRAASPSTPEKAFRPPEQPHRPTFLDLVTRPEIPQYDRPIRLTSIPHVMVSSASPQHEESSRGSSNNTPSLGGRPAKPPVSRANPLENESFNSMPSLGRAAMEQPPEALYSMGDSARSSQQGEDLAAPPQLSTSAAIDVGNSRKTSNDRKSSNASSNLDAPVRKVQTMSYSSGVQHSGQTSSGEDEEPTPYNVPANRAVVESPYQDDLQGPTSGEAFVIDPMAPGPLTAPAPAAQPRPSPPSAVVSAPPPVVAVVEATAAAPPAPAPPAPAPHSARAKATAAAVPSSSTVAPSKPITAPAATEIQVQPPAATDNSARDDARAQRAELRRQRLLSAGHSPATAPTAAGAKKKSAAPSSRGLSTDQVD